MRFDPIDVELAVHSVRLPGEFHADPADRLITALARYYSVPLVTADSRIRNYKHVKTIW
ncbi:type II toxin-antitoxin system VapC family toxin [Methylohalobius crimeensis]|uniref:type II toxin-antitoxin system VapC family toxin n=1 Tax=Methylohalobius crimeensis TaxID=244365 RepID=UPI00389926FE